MKIEAGKFYRTRDGRKVGPIIETPERGYAFVADITGTNRIFQHDGTHGSIHVRNDSRLDLISEWTDDGPVRTVTRQEIIPGTYDGVGVGSEVTGHPQREVMVRIAPDHGPMVCMDHNALTNAAAVLTALADALKAEN